MPNNIRLNRKYAPAVQRPFREVGPEIPQDLGDPLFEAYKGIGKAVAGLGRIAEAVQKRKDDRDEFATKRLALEVQMEDALLFEKIKNEAPLGAQDFTVENLQAYEKRHEEIISNSGLPDDRKQELALELAKYRNSYLKSMVSFEDASELAKVGQDFDRVSAGLAAVARKDPSQFDAVMARFDEFVGAIPEAMPAQVKEVLVETARSRIVLEAGYGEAVVNSKEVVSSLTPGNTIDFPEFFDPESRLQLAGVVPSLVQVMDRAHEKLPEGYSFQIGDRVHGRGGLGGRRIQSEQDELVRKGVSQKSDSVHLKGFGVDVVPFKNGEPDESDEAFAIVATAMKAAAKESGLPLTWGGDWKRFVDKYHFETSQGKAYSSNIAGIHTGDARPLLRQFEGLIYAPKWDSNHLRGGYGSDTFTTQDGRVLEVTAATRWTREDAERDLTRRAALSEQQAMQSVGGKENWLRLPGLARAAIVSVTYNYGHTPRRVALAALTGNIERIAQAVESLKPHNNGVNAGRRQLEANLIRGNAKGVSGKPVVYSGGATGNRILDALTPEQQRTVLSAAESNINAGNAAFQADLTRRSENQQAAAKYGAPFTEQPATVEEYALAWPSDWEQKWADHQKGLRSGATQNRWKHTPPDVIDGELDAVRDQIKAGAAGNRTLAQSFETLEELEDARTELINLRETQPVRYANQHSPHVAAAFGALETAKGDQVQAASLRYFTELDKFFDLIQLPFDKRKALDNTQLAKVLNDLNTLEPEKAASRLANMYKEFGPMFDEAMEQLEAFGGVVPATVAEMIAVYPELEGVYTQAYTNWRRMQDDKQQLPSPDVVMAIVANLGLETAFSQLRGSAPAALRELAAAAYAARGGKVAGLSTSDFRVAEEFFQQEFSRLLGGTGAPDSAWSDYSKGLVDIVTIHPVGVDRANWELGMNRLDDEGLMELLGLDFLLSDDPAVALEMPVGQLGPITVDELLRDGVFVRRNLDQYEVWMQFDGKAVFNGRGKPLVLTIRKEDVQRIIRGSSLRNLAGSPDLSGTVRQRAFERWQETAPVPSPTEDQLRSEPGTGGKLLTPEERLELEQELKGIEGKSRLKQ